MKKTYIERSKIPEKICQNCLNRLHKGCTNGKYIAVENIKIPGIETFEILSICDCAKIYNHNDSTWQLTKTQYSKLHKIKKVKHIKSGIRIQQSLNKRLDIIAQELCRYIVKQRVEWHCQLASKDDVNCSGTSREFMQWAHIATRSLSKTAKFDTQNALCLCSGHHKYYTHKPILWDAIIQKYFPEQWQHVQEIKWRKTAKNFSYVETITRLKVEAEALKKGSLSL